MKSKRQQYVNVRMWPATHKRLRVRAFKEGKKLPQLLDELSVPKRGVPVRSLPGV